MNFAKCLTLYQDCASIIAKIICLSILEELRSEEMNRKHIILTAGITLLILVAISACVRPASTPPKGGTSVATTTGAFPVPGSTQDVMSQLESLATQTAIALQGGGTPVAPSGAVPTQPGPAQAGQTQAVSGSPVPTQPPPQPTTALQTTAPQSTPLPYPTATPGLPSNYTLQKGEYPYCIARRFDINPNQLLAASGLSSGGTYPSGTVLKIPKNADSFPGNRALKSHPTNYTASSGDTAYSIACLFGDVDPNAIVAANGLKSPADVKSGQELYIP
jgi:LysM repeat protein